MKKVSKIFKNARAVVAVYVDFEEEQQKVLTSNNEAWYDKQKVGEMPTEEQS